MSAPSKPQALDDAVPRRFVKRVYVTMSDVEVRSKNIYLRGFHHYPYQHRCHKAEQTKNSSASTPLQAIPRAFFAERKRDANV